MKKKTRSPNRILSCRSQASRANIHDSHLTNVGAASGGRFQRPRQLLYSLRWGVRSICSFRTPGSRYFAIVAALLAVFAFLCGSQRAQAQTNDKTPTGNLASSQLKVTSNLVVVRVVVRDEQGRPVEGLRKEDFKLFDRGEEQTITQFAVESSVAPPSSSVAVRAPGQSAPTSPPAAMPGRFIALYFDDLNTFGADMIQARDAADHYLSANLQPKDRVAIFTSEQVLSDFTSDPHQIHEALFKLHVSSRALARNADCLDLSDYQALEITENPSNQNIDAWITAKDEAAHCSAGFQPASSRLRRQLRQEAVAPPDQGTVRPRQGTVADQGPAPALST
jgi:hypothetical protein